MNLSDIKIEVSVRITQSKNYDRVTLSEASYSTGGEFADASEIIEIAGEASRGVMEEASARLCAWETIHDDQELEV